MTLLDDIITEALNDAVSTTSLLRKIVVVAHNLDAEPLGIWARGELNGYQDIAGLPSYRANIETPVAGFWGGYFQSTAHQPVSHSGIPAEAKAALFTVQMMQSVTELEDLAGADTDPGVAWDPQHVGVYNTWIDKGQVPHLEGFSLVSARRVIPRSFIKGVLNTIRNKALDLALELQRANPEAGTLNGPTVAEPPIASAVVNVTNNIFGNSNNVAVGDAALQHSHVIANDVESLLRAARDVGLRDEGLDALRDAASAASAERPSRLAAVLDRVRTGAFTLAAGIGADVAANALEPLLTQFLGG